MSKYRAERWLWAIAFVVAAIPIGLLVVAVFRDSRTKMNDEHYMIHESITRAQKLAATCYLKSRDGRHPAKFSDLTAVDESDFRDAWGDRFRYAVVTNEAGELALYIWTEHTEDGKLHLIGVKATSDTSITRFGVPGKN